jgi:O-antigen ligase
LAQRSSQDAAAQPLARQAERLITLGLTAIVAVMPFHAFLVITLGHFIGGQALWQAWKEILIVGMAVAALVLIQSTPRRWQRLRHDYNYWAAAFAALGLLISLLVGAFGRPEFWFGLKSGIGFIAVFILAQLVASRPLKRLLAKIHLLTAGIVALLGVIMATLVSPNLLEWFGYGASTIHPIQGIAGSSLQRAFATLGGPNQLGAFLILPICVATAILIRRRQWHYAGLLIVSLTALFFSYSRSAWIGTAVGIITVILLVGSTKMHRIMALGLGALVLIAGLSARHLITINPELDAYLRHEDSVAGADLGSDDKRLEEWRRSSQALWEQPWGRGFGAAGPASFYSRRPLISENYFLQIAIETGLVGLVAFVGFQLAVGWRLWEKRHNHGLAVPLLATLVGINAVNLFLHGWADSTLALVYWTLAGATVGNEA